MLEQLKELSRTDPTALLFVIIVFLMLLIAINYLILKYYVICKLNKLNKKIKSIEKRQSEQENPQSEDCGNMIG